MIVPQKRSRRNGSNGVYDVKTNRFLFSDQIRFGQENPICKTNLGLGFCFFIKRFVAVFGINNGNNAIQAIKSRYGVIQIWPRVLLQLPAPPPQPVDPAERLDPKAKKDWNWAEHLAKLAYQQEQEYNRLKKDPHALTEDKLKAANNAFKLYASASIYAEKSGMTEAVKRLNAAFWRMEHEIEKNFLEPEARRKANQKKHAKDIKALQKEFDAVMENAKPRLEDDERSRAWNRMVLDYLMFKAEAAFAQALEKGLRKVGKKKWNAFRGPIINTVRKLANDAASPDGWLAKRLENPSVADADAIKAFIAEAFGLEPDAIPAGWTYMFDEIAKAMEEMTEGIRGYLDWNGPTPTLDLARPTAAGMSMEDASHLTEMIRTPAQPREEPQPEPTPEPEPATEPAPVEQEPVPEPAPEPAPEQPVEQEPAQPKSEWEEREDLDADLEEPFDAEETEGAWRPRESGKPGMENANGEVAYDWKEENGLLVAEEDGETISGERENFQDEADEALGNITEALPSVEGNVVYLQTNSLEPGKAPTKLVVFGESAQAIAGALDAANVTYRDNFDSIDEKMDEGKETRDGDAYDESHYKVTISGKKNVQAAIQALVGDNGDYGAVVLQDEGGSIRIMLNPKSVDMESVTTLAQAQAANEQLKQGIEERNKQAIEAWEARTGLKYDPEWQEHTARPDGPFREVDGSIVREGTLRNGEWDGEVREYNGDRLTRSVVYKNGVQTGASKEYRFDGTLAVERVPGEDGQSVAEIHYDASGKTENYRLVRGKRGVVLFDSRKQQEQKQEAPAETVAQPATAAKESWEDKSMEAIVQDIRAIRATLRADHTSPLLEPGTVRQKDGTDRTVVYTGGNDGRRTEVRYTRNGEPVGESLEFRRLHNDKTASRLDDFLTLTGTTRYDDNGNPVEMLGYDPDGRIHGRERFRSWRDEDGEWHTKSIDSFVIDEDGVYITREGKPMELLPLDALNETRGQAGNVALSVGGRPQAEAEALRDNWRTFRKDGMRPGFRRAANGKPSNLGEREWLLARTAAFKNVVGDWESLMKRRELDAKKVTHIEPNVIKADGGKSALKAALKWARENLPVQAETEIGTLVADARSVKSSLSHSYQQEKLDAVVSLKDGIHHAVYLGSLPDTKRTTSRTIDHYFAYPAEYKGNRMLVFLRAIEDVNKNRVYVHEVFDEASLIEQAKTKKEKSDSLQTRANTQGVSQPPGGIALYKTILNPLFAVKPEDVKVTLDENNEPLASEVRRVEGKLGKPGNTALSVGGREAGMASAAHGWMSRNTSIFSMRTAPSAFPARRPCPA